MDYMLSFFPEEVLRLQGKSYFHNFVNYIDKHQPQLAISENFKWLKDFAENNYPLINQRRKHFLHAEGYENQFFSDFLDSDTTSLDGMLKLEEQREELLPILKSQMTLSLEGYFKAMDFLNELDFTRDEQTGSFVYLLSNEMSGQN